MAGDRGRRGTPPGRGDVRGGEPGRQRARDPDQPEDPAAVRTGGEVATSAGLALAGVSKRFGDLEALRGLDLDVQPHELVVLVGPSGSGKTTALRIAAGLERPSAGRVVIGGRDVTDAPPGMRDVAMVFQSHALYPHLSAAQNIGFGLSARRVPRAEVERRVAAAAETAKCGGILHRRPAELSGGERQRVALARALVREPAVFLMDEPLSSLDAQVRVTMRAELRRLQQRLGVAMLYVTHDQVEALTLGDRVAVLGDGVVQQVGVPAEIYGRPANRFVATFIGTPAMNLFDVVEGRAGPFPLELSPDLAGRGLQVGVRPEHFELGGTVQAQVEVVEEAGSETYLHLSADGYPIVARVGADVRPALGETVGLRVRAEYVHLFDVDSGEAL